MKILLLSDDFPPAGVAGAGMAAYDSARALVRKGHEVFVITTVREKSLAGYIEWNGLKIHRLQSNFHIRWRGYLGLHNFFLTKNIVELLKSINPDIVHAHNVHRYISYHALKICKDMKKPVVITLHDVMAICYGRITIPPQAECGDFLRYCTISWFEQMLRNKLRYNPFRNSIIKRYLQKYTDRIFVVSEVLQKVLALNGISNTTVIHNGIELKKYQTGNSIEEVFKRKHGLVGKRIIFMAGRISEDKGYQQLTEAFHIVKKKIPEAVLMIAGRQMDTDDDTIISLGWLDKDGMQSAFRASDVIVAPSICFETFGLTVLEAMACAQPAIASCFGGAREIVIDGETGFLVNPYNINILAERMCTVLENPEVQKDMGKKGYQRAKEFFDIELPTDKLLEQYGTIKTGLER